jgi:hypothetical protein
LKKAVVGPCVTVLVILFSAAGCGGGQAPARTPSEVTQDFLETLKDGDYAAAYGMLSSADRDSMTEKQWTEDVGRELAGIDESVTCEVTDEESAKNEAVVGIELTQGGESETFYIVLLKEGGAWKVSLERSDTMNN